MNSLRLEQEQTEAQCQELKAKVKHLEQENLAKEQEITSLSHKNQLLESEVEKLEAGVKQAKEEAALGTQHGTQNESLQRRLQLLEEEAEESDKQMRETNEKYVHQPCQGSMPVYVNYIAKILAIGSAKQMSRLATTSARSKHWKPLGTSGKRNTRIWLRSTQRSRRNWRISNRRSAISRSLSGLGSFVLHSEH